MEDYTKAIIVFRADEAAESERESAFAQLVDRFHAYGLQLRARVYGRRNAGGRRSAGGISGRLDADR